MQPQPLVIIGPSGSGKSTIAAELQRRGVISVTPSWTTRPRRPDERHGSVNHRFVTEDEFVALETDGFFLGTATMFGLPYRYGLPAITAPARTIASVVIRASVLRLLQQHYTPAAVYAIERPAHAVAATLLARRVPRSELDPRLRADEEECRAGRRLASRVFHNDGALADVIAQVASAIDHDWRNVA